MLGWWRCRRGQHAWSGWSFDQTYNVWHRTCQRCKKPNVSMDNPLAWKR